MKLRLLAGLLAALIAAAVFASPARAYTRSGELEHVSKIFANGREWPVRCADTADEWLSWGFDVWTFGITDMAEQYVALRHDLCYPAEHPEDASIHPSDRALAVLTLVHEAYHVRNWSWRWNEARVECQAIRHFKVGAKLLGASQEQANALFPFALAWHYLIARPEGNYYWRGCKVPSW